MKRLLLSGFPSAWRSCRCKAKIRFHNGREETRNPEYVSELEGKPVTAWRLFAREPFEKSFTFQLVDHAFGEIPAEIQVEFSRQSARAIIACVLRKVRGSGPLNV
jgi:hypothetical protein